MAAPVIDPIANMTVPANKTLIVPITASDADGDTLTYNVQTNNGAVTPKIYHGTIDLKLTVAGFGDMTIQLLPQVAPKTVDTIVGLVNGGFYNTLTFHRIIASFMIQGGDPNGNGSGGPGFQFDDEFNRDAIFAGTGQLAMANSGKDTNGSQFFITVSHQRSLDFNYTVFGQLVRGFDVLNAINAVPTTGTQPPGSQTPSDRPLTPVVITSASIVPNPTDAVLFLTSTAGGASTITVSVDDGTGNHVSSTFQATTAADATNDPPILGPVVNAVTATNAPINITLSSTDLENDARVYDAAVVDTTSGATTSVAGNVVTVTPKSGFKGDIRVLVGVRQSNGNTRFDTQAITVTVKDQALSPQAVNTSGVEGGAISGPVAAFTPLIPFTAANYSATINWGDATTSAGTIVAAAGGAYEVRGTKVYNRFGLYPVSVTIHDATSGNTATVDGKATVTDAPLSVQFLAPAPAAGTRTVSGAIAKITDSNPHGTAADLSASIQWGAGPPTTATIVANPDGTFNVVATKTYAALGSYHASVAITSAGGSTASAQTTIIVPNLAPVIDDIGSKTVAEGSQLAFTVVAHDPDPGQKVTYVLAPGAPAGASIDPNTGAFSWTPAVGPATATIVVVAIDNGSPQAAAARAFTVGVTNLPPQVDAGGAALLSQFDTLVKAGRFDDFGAGPWTASVDYGDGTGRQPLALNPDRSFLLVHRYTSAGAFAASVIVTDPGGASGSAVVPVSVAALPAVQVVAVTATKTKGAITAFTIQFNGSINPATAVNAGFFTLVAAGRDKKFGTRDDVITRFRSAIYDGSKITLVPAKRLVLSGTSQLRVVGVRDLFDRPLGNAPGGTFIATVLKSGVASFPR
jgi:cyclophilin family peptidyl-prolyl cis-trans isomerase